MANDVLIHVRAEDKATAVFKGVADQAHKTGSALGGALKAGALGAGAGIVALGGFLATSVKEAMESQKVIAQLEAVLKSTGGAAGVTSKQMQELAATLQKQTVFSDEAVLSAENLLLTFTNIKGPQVEGATRAVLDMATAMGTDLQTAAIQVGKALNDPIGGVTALRRVGVQLSEQQEQQIKDFLAVGDAASAQGVILGELSKEFGGSAAAAADTFGGRMQQLKNQFGELQEKVGMALLPVLTSLVKFLAEKLPGAIDQVERTFKEDLLPVLEDVARIFEEDILPILKEIVESYVIPELTDAFAQLKQTIDGLLPIIKDFLNFLKDNPAALAAVAALLGVLLIALFPIPAAILAIIAGGTLLLAHWDEIRAKVNELVADFQANFPVLVEVIEFVWATIRARVQFFVDEIRAIIKIATALWHGDFSAAWQGIKDMVNGFLNLIKADVENMLRLIVGVVKQVLPDDLISKPFDEARRVIKWLMDRIDDLIRKIKSIPTPGDIFGGIGGAIGGIPGLQHGGTVRKTGLAVVHEGETFSGVGRPGAGLTVNVYAQGSILSERDVTRIVRDAVIRGAFRGMELGT